MTSPGYLLSFVFNLQKECIVWGSNLGHNNHFFFKKTNIDVHIPGKYSFYSNIISFKCKI